MNKFEKLLEKWNNGTFRGAKNNFAKAIGVADTTVSAWCVGRLKPAEDKIVKIAEELQISEEEVNKIFGIKTQKHDIDLKTVIPLTDSNTITLPILAGVPAGLPDYSEEDVAYFTQIPRALFPGASFVVKCIGDSLEPRIMKGDHCVIKKMDTPIEGRPMLVKTENGFTMKIICRDNNKIKLCSLNHGYKPILPKQLEIIGLVIGVWSRQDDRNWLGETRND